MVQEIIWLKGARISFDHEISYLSENFSDKVVGKFIQLVFNKLDIIKADPKFGQPSNKRPIFFKTVINKRIILVYKYKPRNKAIELIVFWNILQNPKRLRF